jgi:hypothetical protein
MPGGHHPRRPVEHRTEIVVSPQLGLAGRNSHPHRQFQRTLGGHRRIDRTRRGGEGGTHTVAGVLEHEAAVRLNRRTQYLVMGGQCPAHGICVVLPPNG